MAWCGGRWGNPESPQNSRSNAPVTKEVMEKMHKELHQNIVSDMKALLSNSSIAEEYESLDLKEVIKSLEEDKKNLLDINMNKTAENARLTEQVKSLQYQLQKEQERNNGRCSQKATECSNRLGQYKKRCKELEQDVQQLQKQLNKLTPMEQLSQQCDSRHDVLSKEYGGLMTSVNRGCVLGQLEELFTDQFDAKRVLSDLFIDAYTTSKDILFKHLRNELLKLYEVHPEEPEEMEGLSSAFGQLLHSTGAKTWFRDLAVLQICQAMRDTLPKLEPCKRAKKNPEEMVLSLQKVAEIAWKFVTEPNPVIVCTPKTFDSKLHDRFHDHWIKGQTNQQLIYCRPVVYRSYHGLVMSQGIVGHVTETKV